MSIKMGRNFSLSKIWKVIAYGHDFVFDMTQSECKSQSVAEEIGLIDKEPDHCQWTELSHKKQIDTHYLNFQDDIYLLQHLGDLVKTVDGVLHQKYYAYITFLTNRQLSKPFEPIGRKHTGWFTHHSRRMINLGGDVLPCKDMQELQRNSCILAENSKLLPDERNKSCNSSLFSAWWML